MTDWRRSPLLESDLIAIDTVTWRAFPRATVIAVAEAWNAGVTTAEMAADLGCSPASLRMMIGRLKQCGVTMRQASEAGVRSMPALKPERSPLAIQLGQEQIARLRRLAPFDKVAARTLALLEAA